MTPEQLKNSILQLAIQGKLTEEFRAQSVERREKDLAESTSSHNRHCETLKEAWQSIPPFVKGDVSEADRGILTNHTPNQSQQEALASMSAEELYKQIQAEKAELIKQGKIKKEKPLPPIKEEEIPFDIPNTWKWARWGDLSYSIQYGYNAPAQENGDIKMVRISDIQNGNINWETVPYCIISKEEIPTYLLKKNDILFGIHNPSFYSLSAPTSRRFCSAVRTSRASTSSGASKRAFIAATISASVVSFSSRFRMMPSVLLPLTRPANPARPVGTSMAS